MAVEKFKLGEVPADLMKGGKYRLRVSYNKLWREGKLHLVNHRKAPILELVPGSTVSTSDSIVQQVLPLHKIPTNTKRNGEVREALSPFSKDDSLGPADVDLDEILK